MLVNIDCDCTKNFMLMPESDDDAGSRPCDRSARHELLSRKCGIHQQHLTVKKLVASLIDTVVAHRRLHNRHPGCVTVSRIRAFTATVAYLVQARV
jgi:hypothetical protein